jgi:hypothetical protein
MKTKNDWKKLAVMGLSTGVLAVSGIAEGADRHSQTNSEEVDINDGNLNYHLLSDDEMRIELSPQGLQIYDSLDEEGKALAREVASSRCNGTNQCAGLNACKTDQNACLGKGTCKYTTKCSISDKNVAVKLVRDKMAKKRAGAVQ